MHNSHNDKAFYMREGGLVLKDDYLAEINRLLSDRDTYEIQRILWF